MASVSAAAICCGLPLFLLVTCGYLASPTYGYQLTVEQVANASHAIRQLLISEETPAPSGGAYRLFVAGFIRLAFYSCVGERCTGCLNVKDASNTGLNLSATALERVRSQLGFDIRRGDLWALAAKVAYEVGVQKAGESDLEADAVRFLYGREDCPNGTYTDEVRTLPNMRWGVDDALQYFRARGFSDRQTVALMGFHTLGVVRDGSKAFGQWVATPDVISNQFYVDLRDKQWAQRDTVYNSSNSTVYMWRSGASSSMIMLNTDMAFLRNFSVSSQATGESSCTVTDDCPLSATAGIVEEFAKDEVKWRREASAALAQLIERGYGAALRSPIATPATACQQCGGSGAVSAVEATSCAVKLIGVAVVAMTVASVTTSAPWQ